MKRLALFYNILIVGTYIGASLLTAKSPAQIAFTFLFIPPLIYFLRLLTDNLNLHPPRKEVEVDAAAPSALAAIIHPDQAVVLAEAGALDAEVISDPNITDINRRLFLKLVGGAGLSIFMMSIFTNKAHASFFGSMPVPGAMTLKDSSGQAIDPAEKQPTDGYEISEIDDSASPAYYGFIHKTGAWYISREDDTGAYRYASGTSDFPGNWALRDTLAYDYFDNVF